MRFHHPLRLFVRAVPRAVALALLCAALACASGPGRDSGDREQRPASRYSGDPGESPVGAIPDVTIHDSKRDKDIALTIEYPTRNGPHPLIVFSHGFGGSNSGYVGLSSYWASQGYVVIKPSHADSGKLRDLNGADDIWASQTPADWANRVRDISFILDSLDQLEERFPELKGKIDRQRIGVGGHSYGAHTAMLIGGAQTFPGGVRYADPRVKAIVAMSPQGPAADRGLTADSWKDLKVPALFMTGSLDRGVTEDETPEWRRQAFALSPAGDKWFVSIEGARHLSFAGRAGSLMERRVEASQYPNSDPAPQRTDRQGGPLSSAALRERDIFGTIKLVSLEFWDAALRGDAAGREALGKAGERKGVTLEKK